jgi:heme/copper-type cytochrome/quinol oxidase subunit 4
MRGCVGSSEIENCVSVIFSLVELVLSIFMFIYMFTSDPGCGKELFVWGIVLLVFFCIWVLVIFCSVRGLW